MGGRSRGRGYAGALTCSWAGTRYDRSWGCQAAIEPLERARRSLSNGQCNDLRYRIAMQVHDPFAQRCHLLSLGFDNEEEFPVFTDFSFPAVDRGETRDDIDAGRKSLLDQRACYCLRFALTTDSD